MLPAALRLRKKKDVAAVHRSGKTAVGRFLLLKFRANDREYSRFAFAVSRKVGGAVVRNRWRRQLRAVVRQKLPGIRPGYDVVVSVRPSVGEGKRLVLSEDMARDIDRVISRAGLWR